MKTLRQPLSSQGAGDAAVDRCPPPLHSELHPPTYSAWLKQVVGRASASLPGARGVLLGRAAHHGSAGRTLVTEVRSSPPALFVADEHPAAAAAVVTELPAAGAPPPGRRRWARRTASAKARCWVLSMTPGAVPSNGFEDDQTTSPTIALESRMGTQGRTSTPSRRAWRASRGRWPSGSGSQGGLGHRWRFGRYRERDHAAEHRNDLYLELLMPDEQDGGCALGGVDLALCLEAPQTASRCRRSRHSDQWHIRLDPAFRDGRQLVAECESRPPGSLRPIG